MAQRINEQDFGETCRSRRRRRWLPFHGPLAKPTACASASHLRTLVHAPTDRQQTVPPPASTWNCRCSNQPSDNVLSPSNLALTLSSESAALEIDSSIAGISLALRPMAAWRCAAAAYLFSARPGSIYGAFRYRITLVSWVFLRILSALSALRISRSGSHGRHLTMNASFPFQPSDPRRDEPVLPVVAIRPASLSVSTQLMQDAVPADGVSVGNWEWNQEALFANPFKDGREEALVLDVEGRLTYLERTDESSTGWRQAPVAAATGSVFAEVVVAVHPNGGVYAFAAPRITSAKDTIAVMVFLLGKEGERGVVAQCSWDLQTNAVGFSKDNAYAMLARNFRSVQVSYSPDAGPTIAGAWLAGEPYSLISASIPAYGGQTHPWTWDSGGVVPQGGPSLAGVGYLPYSAALNAARVHVLYFLQGSTLTRLTQVGFDRSARVSTTQVATSVARFCGTLNIPNLPRRPENQMSDVAAVYLDVDGDLVVSYLDSSRQPAQQVEFRTSGLGFDSATCWQDADGMAHIFGLDGSGTLRVLHQRAWDSLSIFLPGEYKWPVVPGWTRAAVAGAEAGIGGYDLMDARDRLVAFDYSGSGNSDHLLAFRPGVGTVRVLERTPGRPDFDAVTSSEGLPGYDFRNDADTVTAFDYTGSGSADHVIAYRPGAGKYSVFTRSEAGDGLRPVTGVPSGGIGECLTNPADRLVAFDYAGTGKADHLLCYRPGTGRAWVIARGANGPTVLASFTNGLGGFSLGNSIDQVIGFDYAGTGSPDHLLAYRPGAGMVYVLASDGHGAFHAVVRNDTGGIGGWDLLRPYDRLVPFDYTGLGAADHLLVYRPGNDRYYDDGDARVLQRVGTTTTYRAIVRSIHGLGGYAFDSRADTVIAYDYNSVGSLGYLVAYRPGAGRVTVMRQRDRVVAPVYQAPPGASLPVTVGLHTGVREFRLDPYPDYKPSELIKMSGTTSAEAYCLATQDVTTSAWQTDKVRLPQADSGRHPFVVSHYVATATLLSDQGSPMPGHSVSISADSLVEVQVGAVSYQVGPGRAIAVATDGTGRLVVSIAARGLTTPVVHIRADGLEAGAAIDFAAGVNEFLAGTGTLPSQTGRFTPELLENAQTTPNAAGMAAAPLADWKKLRERGLTPAVVVDHCANMYAKAAGDGRLRATAIGDESSGDGSGDGPGGGDQTQPIIGYVIQLWDPDRPAYQVFRSQEELAAYRSYRDSHPAYGGWWDDFVNWASDVWEGVKTGAARVAEVIVSTVVEVAVWIGQAVVSLGELVIAAVEQAAQAVEAVFQMVADTVVRVIDWLKALFSLKDIWNTKTALEAVMRAAIGYARSSVRHFGDVTDGWFKEQEAVVHSLFADLKQRYADTRVGDFPNKIPPATDSFGDQLEPESLQRDPQASWMLNQVCGQNSRDPASFRMSAALGDAVGGAWDDLVAAWQNAHVGTDLAAAVDDIGDMFLALFGSGSGPTAMYLLLDALEHLISALIKAADLMVQTFVAFVTAVLATIDSVLFEYELSFGFVNTIYDWVQTSAGVRQPEKLTIGGLVVLIMAFFGTTGYKLAFGVDQPPVPDGTPPVIPPPPPWHGSGSEQGRAGAQRDPADVAVDLVRFQCYGNFAVGSLAPIFATITDIFWAPASIPVIEDPFSVRINAIMTFFAYVGMGVPSIYGVDDYHTLAVAPWIIWCVFCAPCLFTGLRPEAAASFKNFAVPALNIGPLATAGFGVLALVFTCLANVSAPTSPATWVTGVTTPISFITQSVRWLSRKIAPPPGLILNHVVAGVNMIANLTSLLTPCLVAAVELKMPPRVDVGGQLPGGALGMVYAQTLSAVDGTPPYQAWEITSGELPDGLSLDADTGRINGARTTMATTITKVSVRCKDSYGPPLYTEPWQITIAAPAASPVHGLTVHGGNGQSAQGGTVFGSLLSVAVTDASRIPVAGAVVVFTTPSTGPTGSFPAGSTAKAVSDANGLAIAPPLTAGMTAGTYSVTAEVRGVATTTFQAANTATPIRRVEPAPNTTPQTVQVGQTFPQTLAAQVLGENGVPVRGASVIFTVVAEPRTGAAAYFPEGSICRAYSDATGTATADPLTANWQQGHYTVQASVPEAPVQAAQYDLTNTVSAPAAIAPFPGTTPQQTRVNTELAMRLAVAVTDAAGGPYAGAAVLFTAPETGASGFFVIGGTPSMQAVAYTDSTGLATAPAFTAGPTSGTYTITASIASTGPGTALETSFSVTNTLPTHAADERRRRH
ncbi:MAG: hypothetical protein HOV87_06845 [Catenulispora sp.]|nr:hypothetical protein [Catenulispora sp.]